MNGQTLCMRRTEKKYLLSPQQREALGQALAGRMLPDRYGLQSIANIYYDTPDCRLIARSLERPVYKEKLRMRCYGRACRDTGVFVELKKKYKGIVYKRREQMPIREAEVFLKAGLALRPLSQIQQEIDWFRTFHQVVPMAFVAYEREAYADPEQGSLRITFDTSIRCRDTELSLEAPLQGEPLLENGQTLMEVKAAGALPLWLARELAHLAIFPVSFSKYGRYYQQALSTRIQRQRRTQHVA